MKDRFRSFLRGKGGNIAIFTALVLPVLLVGLGGAVNFSAALSVKSRLRDGRRHSRTWCCA